jgi:adenine C2-methylase RlmN of 23S rRNA A2503 and tRNA A37
MYSKILTSKIDHSANIPTKGLTIETRFVQRRPEYFIVYVSTHTGCVMKCKFCWLTQTGQTSFRHLDVESITRQFVAGRNYWRAHKWLPNAMPIQDALTLLREYEEHAPHHMSTPITFHCTFIAGENDSPQDVTATADLIKSFGFRRAKLNVVRYNPAPNTHYQESPRIEEIFRQYSAAIPNARNYIVPRVSPDVYASCGMFISQ